MRTLYIDIETSPNVSHTWGLWGQNIGLPQLITPSRMMCFAAKWRGERKVAFWSEWEHGRAEMLQAAHSLLTDADVVAHYNGTTFDVPYINRELWLEGILPPAPFQQLDFLRIIRRRFRFPSNKLAHIAEQAEIGGKVKHEGHALWVGAMNGDPGAQRRMRTYCRGDVRLLEPLHDRLMPWLGSGAPNARLTDGAECPVCGRGELRREGFAYTALGAYQRYQCRDCGSWSRDSRRAHGTDVRGMS